MVISIVLCISSALPSTMYAKMPRFAASLTQIAVVRLEQRNHRAGRLADDLGDHVERVLATDAEPDEGQVRMLALGRRCHVCDLELTRDHLMAEPGDDLGDPLEPILALVRNQNPQQTVLLVIAVPGWRTARTFTPALQISAVRPD